MYSIFSLTFVFHIKIKLFCWLSEGIDGNGSEVKFTEVAVAVSQCKGH